MDFSDEIKLVKTAQIPTDTGHPSQSKENSRIVWANKKQAGANEFYKAASAGIKLTAVFQVHTEDYSGEMMIEHEGKTYNVERSYQTTPSVVELSCTDARQDKGAK